MQGLVHGRTRLSLPGRTLGALALAALSLAIGPAAAHAADGCTRVAAPHGSDGAAGTEAAPFATAQHLVDSLRPGETGCLRSGTYNEDVKVSKGGSASARVTLRSYPGERATVKGRFWIAEGADFVTVAQLDLNGVNSARNPSPTVNSNDAIFEDNDVTNDHTEICFLLGNSWGDANRTIIRRNRVHDCGRLPAANQDHGIYVGEGEGNQILDNLIYDNADRGVQLYPDAQRTRIAGNVIDGNGEGIIFGGEHGDAPNDNVVEGNVITNSRVRWNVESWFADGNPIGRNNVVRNNCVFNGRNGNIAPQIGFTAIDNLVRDPKFADRAAKDFRLAADSPCRDLYTGTAAGTGESRPTGTSNTRPRPVRRCPRCRAVALRKLARIRGSRRLVSVSGRVRSAAVTTAGSSLRYVQIQMRTRRGWRTISRPVLASGRFAVVLTVPNRRAGRVLRLRARIPNVGRSRIVRMRVPRRR